MSLLERLSRRSCSRPHGESCAHRYIWSRRRCSRAMMRPMAPRRRSVSLPAGVGTESNSAPPIPIGGTPNGGQQVHVLLVLRISRKQIASVLKDLCARATCLWRCITTCRGWFQGTSLVAGSGGDHGM